jgi:hypothetical protein
LGFLHHPTQQITVKITKATVLPLQYHYALRLVRGQHLHSTEGTWMCTPSTAPIPRADKTKITDEPTYPGLCLRSICEEFGTWHRKGDGPPTILCPGCAKRLGYKLDTGRPAPFNWEKLSSDIGKPINRRRFNGKNLRGKK